MSHELDEEIRFHLDMETEKYRRTGMSETDARRAAVRAFGGVTRVREEVRHMRRGRIVEDLSRDVAYAWRTLTRARAYSLTTVLTLAIAISLAAAILTFVEAVLLRPLPYTGIDRVITLWESNLATGEDHLDVSPANFLDWQARTRSFEALGLLSPSAFDMQLDDRRIFLDAGRIDEHFLRILGVQPVTGRLFEASDYDPGAEPRVLLTYELWRDAFNSDPGVAGKTIQLDGTPATVLGVLPAGVDYPSKVRVYSPLRLYPGEKTSRTGHWLTAVGKLRPGVTLEEARADMQRVALTIASEHRETNENLRVRLIPLEETLLGRTRTLLGALTAASLCLLLLACANAGALTLARGAARRRELAIRSAVGAGTGRLVRQLVTESALLMGFAATLATAGAIAIVRWMAANSPEDLRGMNDVRAGATTALLAFAIALVAVMLSGLLPAIRLVRGGLARDLEASRRDSGLTPAEARLQGALVMVQIAMALLLLTGAALLTRSVQKLTSNNLGFDPRGMATMQMFLYDLHRDRNERAAFIRTSLASMRALPGVVDAAATTALPFEPAMDPRDDMTIAGRPPLTGESMTVKTTSITPGYFRTMKIPLREGRDFTDLDTASTQRVAIVNDAAVRRFWRNESPLGAKIQVGIMGPPREWIVVGVAGSVRDSDYGEAPRPEIYVPIAQSHVAGLTYIARTSGSADVLLQSMQERLWELTPSQTIATSGVMTRIIGRTLQTRNFALTVMGGFGAVALAVSAIGLFGLLTYITTRRRHEVGVRLALGATPRRIEVLFIRRGFDLIAAGIVCGVLASILFSRALDSLLYETSALDPVALSASLLVMTAAGVLACWIPARRIASLHPGLVLREE